MRSDGTILGYCDWQLADEVRRYGEMLTTQLVPVLASQLPRLLYRSISNGFLAAYRGEPLHVPSAVPPPVARPMARN